MFVTRLASLLAIAVALDAVPPVTGAALAADPPKARPAAAQAAPPPTGRKPGESCGELARGSRAFKECIAIQSRRDVAAPGTAKPAFSSR